MNLQELSNKELVDLYNRHCTTPVKRFADHKTAVRRVSELLDSLKTDTAAVVKQKTQPVGGATGVRPAMQASLKLDRRIYCEETKEVWKNAHQMWLENPKFMTSAQQDRLTKKLYDAAKQGKRIVERVNDLNFCLVHVEGLRDYVDTDELAGEE